MGCGSGTAVAFFIAVGVFTNVVLNLLWLPLWGLQGAVMATLVANAVVLLGIWFAMSRHGYELDSTTFFATVLPVTLLAGPGVTLVCIAVLFVANPRLKAWCREALADLKQSGRLSWFGL